MIGIILFAFSAKTVLTITLSNRDKIGLAIIGLGMFAVFPFFMAFGLSYTTAARGGLLYATMPLATIIIATLFKIEQPTFAKILSVILAMAGIFTAIGAKSQGNI